MTLTGEQIIDKASALKQKFGLASDSKIRQSEKSLVKGLIAGMVGGIAATFVKSLGERIYPPRTDGQPEPPSLLAEKILGHKLSGTEKTAATEVIHWGFGALTGAAYGALAEFYPAATSREGANFGITLMGLTHESALPALGLAADPEEQTTREHTSELVTHILYGVTTEVVRSLVRRLLH